MIAAEVVLTQPLGVNRQFVATTGTEHHMLLDDAAGGTGPKPIELVAVGLGGCTAFDVITVFRVLLGGRDDRDKHGDLYYRPAVDSREDSRSTGRSPREVLTHEL